MKKILFLLIAGFLFTTACQENMPVIPCLSCDGGDGPDLNPEDKKVIIEEFTGVRCVNCPAGSAEIQNLLNFYGEQLIAISIHAGFYANPYPESQFDLSTQEGSNLENFLGLPVGYPTSVIDRKLFQGEPDLQLEGTTSWGGYIAQQLEEDAKITLDIVNNWDPGTRKLTIDISGGAIEAVDEEVRLSIMLVESGIKDTQLTPSGKQNDYSHKHVLRGMATAYDGDVIAASGMAVGDLISEQYIYDIPEDWSAGDCVVVAFVHNGTTNKEIIQADEKHFSQ